MECCVCWNTLPSALYGASFSLEGHCRPDHLLCTFCYTQCTACPLCRFSPNEKPAPHAEVQLDILRENKNRILDDLQHTNNRAELSNQYTCLIEQMGELKDIINASNSRMS